MLCSKLTSLLLKFNVLAMDCKEDAPKQHHQLVLASGLLSLLGTVLSHTIKYSMESMRLTTCILKREYQY